MYAKLGRTFVRAWPLAIAIAIIAGMAAASIPDSGGLINGCYKRATGALRVVDPAKGQTCTDRETPLSWSQTGPQGEPGIQGQDGSQGPPGTVIAARIRATSPPYVIDNQGNQPGQFWSYPLSPAIYVQPADTLALLYVQVTVVKPAVCDMSAVPIELKQNGNNIWAASELQTPAGQGETVQWDTILWESGGQSYEYSARVAGCTGTTVDLQIDIVEIA